MKHNRSYDIILLDGVPGAPKRTAELIPSCDLIILPTGASRADLVPSLALARRIVEMKLTIDGPVFARCRIMTANEASEARATICNAGFETLDGELVERPGYRQAQNAGRNPTETAFPTLSTARPAASRAASLIAVHGARSPWRPPATGGAG